MGGRIGYTYVPNPELRGAAVRGALEARIGCTYAANPASGVLQRDATRSSIMGGDWNVLLDTALDYASRSGGSYSGNEGAVELRTLMASKGLRDVFREHNPRERMYTRFDAAHEVYTRLDRWLAPPTLPSNYHSYYGGLLSEL